MLLERKLFRQLSLQRLNASFLLLCSLLAFQFTIAQAGRPVVGKVTTEREDLPLQAVTVSVKGSSLMTTTDVNGNFRINVTNGATLVFTSVGFLDQEVAYSGQSNLIVRLATNARTLNEVVVTVPYGRQTRASYTG